MPALDNPKHEAFAQAVAEGLSAAEAHRQAYPGNKPETSETNGPKMLRSAQVALRVEELRGVQRAILEKEFEMSRADVLRFLVEVVKTPIGKIDENHPLCQEYAEQAGPNGVSYRYKMPSKLDAAEKIIKMAGYYAPEKVEHSGTMVGLLARLTGAKK